MEKLPKIIDEYRIPIEINIQPYMYDHQIAGRAVLPAVESCQLLANNIVKHIPQINPFNIYNALFNKLIFIEPGQTAIQAINEFEIYEDGTVTSKLLTKKKSIKSGITRTNEHVILQFRQYCEPFQELTYDFASALDGICMYITPNKIYKELIFFGPAYQNITDMLYIAHNGVITNVFAAPHEEIAGSLGCQFVFDAALHAANIWGQRYFNTVAFPVGFKRRIIQKPTIAGKKYYTRVIPIETNSKILEFDIWIYDSEGNLYEAILGVRIKDINNGRIKPPDWILEKNNSSLKYTSLKCEALSVVEIDAISNFAIKSLSTDEISRTKPMIEKRKKSFTSARLACKFLTKKLSKEYNTPAHEIITIIDDIYPSCPLPDGTNPYKCSVSHDNRFSIAVASLKRIGIDVEEISERVLKSAHLYTNDDEMELVHLSNLDEREACLRIWSIKEAVTKALDIKLIESWRIVEVTNIGINISTLLLNENKLQAYHDTIDNHLFTLVELE